MILVKTKQNNFQLGFKLTLIVMLFGKINSPFVCGYFVHALTTSREILTTIAIFAICNVLIYVQNY